MLRAMVILGTRPEAVKLAPVIRALRQRPAQVQLRVVASGQHREMLEPALAAFGIAADLDLRLMELWNTQLPSLAEVTGAALAALDKVLGLEAPEIVVVQGDTATALAGAQAAFYRKIPVAHVEAGLRTHSPYDPFPEEANRRLIAVLASLHFAPTQRCKANLLAEGIALQRVFVTGNTAIDSLHDILARANTSTEPLPESLRWLPVQADPEAPVLLVTLHRREAWGAPIARLVRALSSILDDHPNLQVVFPVHPNPAVREPVVASLGAHPRAHVVEPLDYPALVRVLQRCYLVVTDSGGLQEEAPALGKPVLVARETTERIEGLDAGVARLVGTSPEALSQAIRALLHDRHAYARMASGGCPYGDGHAAGRIASILLDRGAWRAQG